MRQKLSAGILCTACAALALPLLAVPANAAGDADDPLAPMRQCRQLADVAAKAACYDRAMDALEADRKAHKFSIVSGERIEGLQREAFGFRLPSLPKLRLGGADSLALKGSADSASEGKVLKKNKAGEVVRVAYQVTRVLRLPNGRTRMVLRNGQVWEQVGSDAPRFRGAPPYDIQIKKASLGSYLMRVGKSKHTVRVHRIQ